MAYFRNFAVVGAGGLGSFIVHELLKQKVLGKVGEVTILSRTITGLDRFASQGAKLVPLDYDNVNPLKTVLKGTDVIISTVAKPAIPMQDILARVAKDSGVKLFVPSEFGMPTLGGTTGLWGLKNAHRLALEQMGVPYTIFFTGGFTDASFGTDLGFDFPNARVHLAGSGNNLVSFTSRVDIARYVIYVLISLPPSALENAVLRIEGERATHVDALQQYETATGKKLDITCESVDSLRATLLKNPMNFRAALFLSFEAGNGLVGKPEELTNDLYPDWNPQSILDVLLSEDNNVRT
ncbi:NADP-binding protein [Dacryopinax primogenitus]|uniref:NADP-binding protein n=1 Tax=Dacryopinax primogenitus (strain DJM 731) TaxID=1858805 RepID=M5FVY8_DACPD|nr:NADP-binding protein [Dacryopinax primogenitus]EJU02021.1 NADP-binding protein [Dacryopinax primogenitus]